MEASGYQVCGIASTVDAAVALGESHKPDFAVIDLRLADEGFGPDIARQLDRRHGLGILYATGGGTNVSLTRADGEGRLAKPYRMEDVVRALEIVAQIVRTGRAQPPFPRGFDLLDDPSGEDGFEGHPVGTAASSLAR